MPDVLLNVQSGLSAGLQNVAIENGTLRVTTDTQKLYVDLNNVRVPFGDVVLGNTEAQIKAITGNNALPKVYLASDTLSLFFFDTTVDQTTSAVKGWTQIGLNGAVERAVKDGNGNVITSTYETIEGAQTRQNTLQGNIDALAAVVGQINSFEYQIISDISQAPIPGSSNIIYFVPDNAIPTNPDYNVYKEYLWLTTTPANPDAEPPVAAEGHYEVIGTTETDLSNYYTKTESDTATGNLWAALGLTATDITTTGFETIDARITALETDSSSADGIAEINAKIGADYPDSTDTGFSSINDRLTGAEGDIDALETEVGAATNPDAASLRGRMATAESDIDAVEGRLDTAEADIDTAEADIDELEAKFGAYAASTDNGFVSVEDRFTADEADIAEINAKLGNMAASTDSGFNSVEDRLTALESDSTSADGIAEINAKFGTYAASTDTGFVSVENRFAAAEGDIDALETEVGAATNPDAASLRGRMATAESDIDALETEVGAATNPAATSLRGRMATAESDIDAAEGRLDTAEADIDELQAQIGNLDSTVTGYRTIDARITSLENDTADADAVTEINAKLGNYADSTDTGFVSVEDRFTAAEGRLDTAESDIDAVEGRATALETEVGAATNPDAASLRGRMATAESDIDSAEADIAELQAQLGSDYPASTDTGFKSVNTRLSELVTAIGNINKFDIQVVQTLPATGESYVIYFVPVAQGADDNDGHTKYIEYMWIVDSNLPAGGYYEEIGITEADLSEYYTSAEVDSLLATEQGRIGTLEDAIGVVDPTATGYVTIMSRLGTAESDIDELEAKFGAYAASTASGFTTVEARFTAVEGRATALETEVGAATNPDAASLRGRMATAESDIDAAEADIAELQAQIGNLDSTATGYQTIDERISAIEAGSVTQSPDNDDAEKPVLVSGGNDHDEVEYVAGVTVNADDNSLSATSLNATNVNATTATADSVVLGDATLTFDSSTGALVINF